MSYLQTRIITHRQRVCSLYKRALRNAEDWAHDRGFSMAHDGSVAIKCARMHIHTHTAPGNIKLSVWICFRFEACQLRQRFEEHRHETDIRKAKKLLEDGEKELKEILHFQPHKFPESPGGVAYQREVRAPDWVVDYWHPLEKAQYPEYFARREQRKKEYVEKWEREFGKPEIESH